jgi:uncharacterized protein YxeA
MKRFVILVLVVIVSVCASVLIKKKMEGFYVPKISFNQAKHDFDTLRNQEDANYYLCISAIAPVAK